MVTKLINNLEMFFIIGKFNDLEPQLEDKKRLCPIHNENVFRRFINPGVEVPAEAFGQNLSAIEFTGCCPEAIDSEINFIESTVRENEVGSFNEN